MRLLIAVVMTAALLAACQRPAPPDPQKPPAPRAVAPSIAQPLERAKGVQSTMDAAAERERKAEADATR